MVVGLIATIEVIICADLPYFRAINSARVVPFGIIDEIFGPRKYNTTNGVAAERA